MKEVSNFNPFKPLILTVSTPPHRHCGKTVQRFMLFFLLALLPAAVMAVASYGLPAFRVMALAMSVAVWTELACDQLMQRKSELLDLHALSTGLCFAFLLPASAPWWLVASGSALCIVFGKMLFGGLGGSPFCAPLIGWAICQLSWPDFMDINASMLTTTLSSPLAQLKYFGLETVMVTDSIDLLAGNQLGGLGVSQVAGIMLGGLFLFLTRSISWQIPTGVIAGVLLAGAAYQAVDPELYAGPVFHLLTGSTLFVALFLAPDWSSSPARRLPMFLFGLSAGVLIIVIRTHGVYPDGAPFALLLANLLTPTFDRIRPKPFGAGESK